MMTTMGSMTLTRFFRPGDSVHLAMNDIDIENDMMDGLSRSYFADATLPDALLKELHEQKVAAFNRGITDSRQGVAHDHSPFAIGSTEWIAWSNGYSEAIEADRKDGL